jgi:hypothetical protein
MKNQNEYGYRREYSLKTYIHVILSSSDLPGNPNAIFISGVGKSMGRSIDSHAISFIYSIYKRDLFPKLSHNQMSSQKINKRLESC